MKTPEEMAKEYVKQEQLEYDEAGGAYYGFLAGYKAAMKKYDIALIEEKIKRESKEVLMSLLQQRAKEIAED